tara:strand:+ start:10355 stop:10609 length:255 start_codon:yes stop_codon:yes gene_type:complete
LDAHHWDNDDCCGVFTLVSEGMVTKIERLRELADASKEDRKAIDELVDENLRLRKLLKKCQPYIAGWPEARELFSEIKKEAGDE